MGLQLKSAAYRGFHGYNGAVRYVIVDRNVYFSGITPPDKATSTINAAEAVIEVLANEAGCPARFLTFYDVQTHRGYGQKSYPPGSFEISCLDVTYDGAQPSVNRWITQLMSDDRIMRGFNGIRSADQLPGVPAEILELFQELID